MRTLLKTVLLLVLLTITVSAFFPSWTYTSEELETIPAFPLTSEEMVWLDAHPVIRVANEPDYVPFDFRIDGKPAGYSIDYVTLLADRLGIRLEFVPDTWDNILQRAENKEIDLVHSIFEDPVERKEYLNFTKPYKEVINAIVTRDDLEGIESLQDLAGKTVALEVLRSMLTSFSFDADAACSGQEALELVKKAAAGHPYDLVLMDWKMPQMDGIETAEQIKQQAELPHVPIIIMITAYSREEVMQQAKHSGLDGFLIKPVNPSVLLDTIMELLGQQPVGKVRLTQPITSSLDHLQALWGSRILVVEDNAINRQIAQELLQHAGVCVDIANNGKEAVERILDCRFESVDCKKRPTPPPSPEGNMPYDAILMDIQMPEMDGYEATRQIRNYELGITNSQDQMSDSQFVIPNSQFVIPHIPIIAMTAHAMSGEREKCLDAGMNDYVSKPIDPEHLFAVLLKWVKPYKQLSVSSEQLSVSSEQLSVSSEQLSVGSDQYSVNSAQSEAGKKRLITDNRSLSTENCSLNTEKLPGIDIENGLRRLMGNQELYRKLLREFSTAYAHAAGDARAAWENGDLERVKHLAHTLKGLAGNIGATAIYEASEALEMGLKHQTTEIVDRCLKNLADALNLVLQSIDSLHGEHPASQLTQADPPNVFSAASLTTLPTELLTKLEQAVITIDMALIEQAHTEIRAHHAGLADALAQLIDDYEYDEILRLIQEVKEQV